MALVGALSGSIRGGAHSVTNTAISGSVVIADRTAALWPEWPGSNVTFFVSGTIDPGIGQISATPPGADLSLFGGDMVISGALKVGPGDVGGTLSGSIHRTAGGLSYLMAGANVTVTSASNGQVTIASTGGGGSTSPGGSDTQLQYNNGGAFGGLAELTWDDTDFLLGSGATTKLQIRDTGLYIHSPTNGTMVAHADTKLILSGTTVCLSGSAATATSVQILADDDAGGIDVDSGTGGYNNTTTGKLHLSSSINSGDGSAIALLASAGGIQIDAVGAADEDITIANTGGSVNILATEAADNAIRFLAQHAAGGFDVDSGTGGYNNTSTGILALSSSMNHNSAIQLLASAGGMDIVSEGAAGEDIDMLSVAGSINITAGEAVADALVIDVSGNGGMDLTVGNAANDVNANLDMIVMNKLNIDAQGTDNNDGVEITLGADDANVKFNVQNNGLNDCLTVDGLRDTTIGRHLTVTGNVLPSSDTSSDLGSVDKRWQNIYTGDLHLANERGDWTVVEEPDYLSLRNNSTGKTYKILMELIPDDGE
tara:strand:- start:472 stop:2094 length:1623 start_codon:yes stop_codon:yes gene_type:complete